MDTLSRFAVETDFSDLPEHVVEETKHTLLDHVGCALGAVSTEKGEITAAHARRLGGTGESTVIGHDDRVSCVNAAFANGELMLALDYSGIVSGGHDGVHVLPPLLAMAEVAGASGRELLTATAIGMEVSGRLGRGLGKHAITPEEVRARQERESSRPTGNAYSNVASAAGAGRLLGLDGERLRHAMGIAGHLTMILNYSRWAYTDRSYMGKYGMPGWQNTGAVRATLLAEMGYVGDVGVLDDPEHGFTWIAGFDHWEPGKVTRDLGGEWVFPVRMHYKPYPCCGAFHSALDCFYSVVEEHDLGPDEIDRVTAITRGKMDGFPEEGMEGAQFDPHHVFAVAAHRVPRGPEWYTPETMEDPNVEAFGEMVSCVPHPDYAEARREDPLSEAGGIEVEARGRTFREERRYRRGTAGTEAALTEAELVEKFRRNAAGVLSEDRIDRAVERFTNLEAVEDVGDLMRTLTP